MTRKLTQRNAICNPSIRAERWADQRAAREQEPGVGRAGTRETLTLKQGEREEGRGESEEGRKEANL